MKSSTPFLLLTALIIATPASAQHTKPFNKQLTTKEITTLFDNKLKFTYPIYRAYQYTDKGGKHFLIMTENNLNNNYSACYKTQQNCITKIKAYNYHYKNGKCRLEWQMNDFILPKNEVDKEYFISFWTKYFQLADYDNDGLIEPIIVYGTLTRNGTSDGRIKILTYYHGKKVAIRHQNGTLDYQRNTQVDKAFYQLPTAIQTRVKTIMQEINNDDNGIFPYGWQKAMKKQKLKFSE